MNENQILVVEYLVEKGIIDGLQELDNGMKCVPLKTQVAYEELTILEYYDALTESIKKLKEKL